LVEGEGEGDSTGAGEGLVSLPRLALVVVLLPSGEVLFSVVLTGAGDSGVTTGGVVSTGSTAAMT
jgi:hypothetical protein